MFPFFLLTTVIPVSLAILIAFVAAVVGASISAGWFYAQVQTRLEAHDKCEETINFWRTEFARMTVLNRDLEKRVTEISDYVEFSKSEDSEDYTFPLLAIVGSGDATRDDLSALRQSGVDVLLSHPPTLAAFEKRLNHLRSLGRLPKGLHFSLHSGPDGINFEDQLATIEWLSDNISGINVIVISGCEGSEIGMSLCTVDQRIVTVQHRIEAQHASLLTRVFWTEVAKGKSVTAAFRETRRRLPPFVSELIELH